MTDNDEQWLHDHRDKIEPLMLALVDHFGHKLIAKAPIDWKIMEQEGRRFAVAELWGTHFYLSHGTHGDLEKEPAS